MKTLKNFPIYKKCAKQTENQNANIQKKTNIGKTIRYARIFQMFKKTRKINYRSKSQT